MNNKFVLQNSPLDSEYWDYCNKEKLPFITVASLNKEYDEIFYDITNISNDLENISESVKAIFSSYNKFFNIPEYIIEPYNDQYYYFGFPVLKEHTECVANQLFDFLCNCMKFPPK